MEVGGPGLLAASLTAWEHAWVKQGSLRDEFGEAAGQESLPKLKGKWYWASSASAHCSPTTCKYKVV